MSKLRAAFDTEREWLRGCGDERGVVDRMAAYRHNLATARSNGNEEAENLVEELIELAEDRLAALKADAIRANERAAAPPPGPPRAASPPPAEPPPPPRAAPVRVEDSEVYRRLQADLAASQDAQRRAEEAGVAAERSARRANEERDAVIAAQRQQASAAKARTPTPEPQKVANNARLSPPATLPSWPSSAPRGEPSPPSRASTGASAAPAGGAEPPSLRTEPAAKPQRPAPTPPAPSATRVDRPPANPPEKPFAAPPAVAAPAFAGRDLTGADLAAFRRSAGLTQVAAAQRLGVTQGTISKAEGNPRTVLGPALHEALRLATR